jgi:hypothetical protein
MKNFISVSKTHYEREALISETHEEDIIQVPKFEGPVANIEVGGGLTLNIGNFQSVRIDVRCQLPCYPILEDMNNCYNVAKNFVEEKIKASVEEVRKPKTTKAF